MAARTAALRRLLRFDEYPAIGLGDRVTALEFSADITGHSCRFCRRTRDMLTVRRDQSIHIVVSALLVK